MLKRMVVFLLSGCACLADIGNQGPAVQSATNTPYQGAVAQCFATNKSRHVCWYSNGSWWGVFFVPDAAASGNGEWHIFRKGTSAWTDTTVVVDGRDTSRPNVVYYAGVLWVYSCHGTQAQIYKLTYSAGWTLADGYPYNAPGAHSPVQQYTDTFTVDTNGYLWAFWIPQAAGDQNVQYAYSNDAGQNWTTGNLSTLSGLGIAQPEDEDKLYALRFNDGTQRLGLVIGDETNNRVQFVYRNDATAIDGAWVAVETVESTAGYVDDHLDAMAYGDKVYLVNKTSLDTVGQPVTVLYVRDAAPSWTRTTVWNENASWSITRPRIAIDGTAGEIYVIAANHIAYADDMIVFQKSAMASLSFSPDSVGTTIISRRDAGIDIDNVCIAKEQICTAATGIYPVACDASNVSGAARYYYWGVAKAQARGDIFCSHIFKGRLE